LRRTAARTLCVREQITLSPDRSRRFSGRKAGPMGTSDEGRAFNSSVPETSVDRSGILRGAAVQMCVELVAKTSTVHAGWQATGCVCRRLSVSRETLLVGVSRETATSRRVCRCSVRSEHLLCGFWQRGLAAGPTAELSAWEGNRRCRLFWRPATISARGPSRGLRSKARPIAVPGCARRVPTIPPRRNQASRAARIPDRTIPSKVPAPPIDSMPTGTRVMSFRCSRSAPTSGPRIPAT
jgi:hypothetical protein